MATSSNLKTTNTDGEFSVKNYVVNWVGSTTNSIELKYSGSAQMNAAIFEVTYTAGNGKQTATLTWTKEKDVIELGDVYTAPTLSIDPEAARANVVYESSDETVATVNNGVITLVEGATGTAVITASIPSTDETYKATPAVYTLKVTDPNAPKFELVTNVADLKNGTKIIIVSTEKNKALSTTQKNDNRAATNVEIVDNLIEPGEDVQIIEIKKNGDNYAFYVTGEKTGYLNAITKSGSGNYLRTQEEAAFATISIDSNNNATIKYTGFYRNLLQYNGNNTDIFSCYLNAQSPVQIYAQPNTYKVEASMNVTPVEYVVNGKVIGKANLLSLKPTIYVNGALESDLAGYEIYLEDTKIGDVIDGEISGFSYTGANQQFSVHVGSQVEKVEINGLTFETNPKIEGVEFLDDTDEEGNTSHHVVYYVKPVSVSPNLNWVVTAPETGKAPDAIYWRNNENFEGVGCHFYNVNEDGSGAPASFDVRISYPIAIPKAQSQGLRLMAEGDSEYTYELYHAAVASLNTADYVKNESNTSTSGVADVAVDEAGEVEFFNLQGVRVNGELTPGLYIRRQGNTAVKVVINN